MCDKLVLYNVLNLMYISCFLFEVRYFFGLYLGRENVKLGFFWNERS